MNTENIRKAVEESAKLWGAEGYEIDIDSSVSAGAEALKDEYPQFRTAERIQLRFVALKTAKAVTLQVNSLLPKKRQSL